MNECFVLKKKLLVWVFQNKFGGFQDNQFVYNLLRKQTKWNKNWILPRFKERLQNTIT